MYSTWTVDGRPLTHYEVYRKLIRDIVYNDSKYDLTVIRTYWFPLVIVKRIEKIKKIV